MSSQPGAGKGLQRTTRLPDASPFVCMKLPLQKTGQEGDFKPRALGAGTAGELAHHLRAQRAQSTLEAAVSFRRVPPSRRGKVLPRLGLLDGSEGAGGDGQRGVWFPPRGSTWEGSGLQLSQDTIAAAGSWGRSSPKPPADSQETGSQKSAALKAASTGGAGHVPLSSQGPAGNSWCSKGSS